MPMRNVDKRGDFIHAYEVAAQEARASGHLDEAAILEARSNQLRIHTQLYPNLAMQPKG